MAFGDRIQTATNTGTSGAANVTFSAAVAGNLLVFTITRSAAASGAGDVFSTPSGWAVLPAANDTGDNMAAGGWYKIAAGGETSVALDGTNESGNWTAIVNEYEGAFDATPLDVVAEDESNTATAVTSQASGTTATTAQADELAVAYFGIDNGGNFGTKQYSNSFAEQGVLVSGARAGSTQATRVLTATGTYSTTLSYSAGGSADEMYGAIVTFKKAAGGSPLSIALDTLTLLASAEDLTVTPGAVAILLDVLSLAASAETLTVLTGVAVLLDTLTLAGTAEDTAVSPGAVAVLMDTLTLLATIEDTAVLAGAVAVLLDSLTLAGSLEDLMVATAVAVLLDSLTLAGNVPDLAVVPGATAVSLDTLTLAATLPDLTAALTAILIQVLSVAVIVPMATAAGVTAPVATADAVEAPAGEVTA